MNRLKTYDATGIAPNGRLFAGDINALEDAVAALADLTQNLEAGSIAIGEAGLQLIRYGAGEARITGALRTDGILRGLGGVYAGSFTTTQRNAIANPPYGLVITNSTTNQLEMNYGTPVAPSWGSIGVQPPFSTADISDSAITSAKIADGTIVDSDLAADTLTARVIAANAITASELADNAVDTAAIAASAVTNAKIADGAVTNAKLGANATFLAPGTFAAIPAANTAVAGTLYFATDTLELYRSNGAAWVLVGRVPDGSGNFSITGNFRAESGGFRLQRHPYPNERHIETGAFSAPIGQQIVSFTNAFGVAPVCVATPDSSNNSDSVVVLNRTTTNFQVWTSTASTILVCWMAEGQD